MRPLLLCCFLFASVQDRCSGLDPDPLGLDDALEYRYNFEGRVAVDQGGVGSRPGCRAGDQMAGAAIAGKLVVQKTGHTNVGFKLSELKVGDHLGSVECDGAAPLPVTYRPMPQPMAAQLSKPFFFHLDLSNPVQHSRLEVPKDDPLWMVNVRKSLLNNLQDYMVTVFAQLHRNRNFDMYLRQKASIIFSPVIDHIKEDTLFGVCDVWYTVESTSESSLNEVRRAPLTQDLQSPKFQGRKLSNGRRISPFASESLMKVTRVIDHARCLQQPRLIRSAAANFSDFGRPSPAHHLQRHSTYTYYVRGNPFSFYRLEHVRVEGFLSYYPFGFKSERLQTLTNQTILLESVSEKQENLQPDGEQQVLSSIKQGVESPYDRPSHDAPDWIDYDVSNSDSNSPEPVYWERVLLGQHATDELQRQYKDELRELLRSSVLSLRSDVVVSAGGSAESLGGSSAAQAVMQLHSAARLAAALPTAALRELWDDIPESHRETFLKVLSTSGSGPAAGLVLHLITPQGPDVPVPARRHPPLLLAMAANTPDPSLVGPLVQYLQAMSLRKEPVVGPIVYVSGATILRRMCTNSSALPSHLYGAHQCPVQYVVENFAHYLRKMIETSAPERWWERAGLLQAYVTLGLDVDLALLKTLGRTDPNLIVRTTAVYALSPRYLSPDSRLQAMEIAYTNVVDPRLDRELRQSSLVVLLSWSPDQQYWDQLALYTWSNQSSPIVRFLYSSMLAVADNPHIDPLQSGYAASALLLARAVRTPLRSSAEFAWFSRDVGTEMQLQGRHASFRFPPAPRSSQVYHSLRATAGKLDFNVFELAAGFNHYPGVISPVEQSSRGDGTRDSPQMKLLFKLLSMEVYLPIDFAEFGIGSHSTCPLCELLWYSLGPCGSGSDEEVLLFGELAAMEAFIPNEMGLPILTELTNPTVLYSNTSVAGSSCSEPLTGQFNLTTDTKLVSKLNSVLRVMVPWLNSSIAVGIDTEKTLTLPLKMSGKFEKNFGGWTTPPQRQDGGSFERSDGAKPPLDPDTKIALTLAVQTTRSDLTPVVVTQAVPFTCIKPLRPGPDLTALERLQVLRNSNAGPVVQTIKLGSKVTGFDASLSYEGDQPSPYSLSNVIDHIRTPAKFVSLFGSRSGKYERSVLSITPPKRPNHATVVTLFIDTGAVEKSSMFQAAGDAFCSSSAGGVASECPHSTTLGAQVKFPSGHTVAGNLTRYLLTQADPLYASAAASLSLAHTKRRVQHQIYILGNTTRPVDLSLPQLADWLRVDRNLNASFELSAWAGAASPSSPPLVLTLKASAGVTHERRRLLLEKVKTACSADLLEPALAIDGLAVYDVLNVTAHRQHLLSSSLGVPWRAVQDYLFTALYPAVLPAYGECGCGSSDVATLVANRSLLTNTWSASCPTCCRPWTATDLRTPRCFDTSILALAKFTNFSSDSTNEYYIPKTTRVVTDTSLPRIVDTLNTPQPLGSSLRFDYSSYDESTSPSWNDDYYGIVDRNGLSDDYNNDDASLWDEAQGSCWTSNDMLKTADGLRVTKIPSSCYQLAVAHCYFEPEWYVFTHVDVNSGADVQSPFFRYLDANFDVDVYLGFNTLIINGRHEDAGENRISITHPVTQQLIGWCSASNTRGQVSCTITGVVHIEAGHKGGKVKLLGSDRVCGMCGDNNGVKSDDNVGAHLCRYRDLSLMAASWTKEFQCPWVPELDEQLVKVHAFQNSGQCARTYMPRPWRIPDLSSLPELPRLPLIRPDPSFPNGPAPISNAWLGSEPGQYLEVGPGWEPDYISDSQLEPEIIAHPEILEELEPRSEPVHGRLPDVVEPEAGPSSWIYKALANQVQLVPNEYSLDRVDPDDDCFIFGYKVDSHVSSEHSITASLNATFLCDREKGCETTTRANTNVWVAEWEFTKAPLAVTNALRRGYLLQQPNTGGAKIRQMNTYTSMVCNRA